MNSTAPRLSARDRHSTSRSARVKVVEGGAIWAAPAGAVVPAGLPPSARRIAPSSPVSRRQDQPQWQDPASGYLRRNVSPPGVPQPMQIVEVHFPPGARVAFENGARDARVHQQIWVLDGTMDITVGEERHRLREGDCLAMQLGHPTMFHNPTRKPSRYAVVIASETPSRR